MNIESIRVNAPEGATHYDKCCAIYYKLCGDRVLFDVGPWDEDCEGVEWMNSAAYKTAEALENNRNVVVLTSKTGAESKPCPLHLKNQIESAKNLKEKIIAEREATNAKMDEQIEQLNDNIAEMKKQLKELGFVLLEEGKISAEPPIDMNDPKNWREGDLIEFTSHLHSDECFSVGSLYKVECTYLQENSCGTSWRVNVSLDDEAEPNGWCAEYFKFHSRPSVR